VTPSAGLTPGLTRVAEYASVFDNTAAIGAWANSEPLIVYPPPNTGAFFESHSESSLLTRPLLTRVSSVCVVMFPV
jgi:hypothetical protein